MNGDEYQVQAARTLSDTATQEFTVTEIEMVERTVALALATARLCELVKKGILHKHGLAYNKIQSCMSDIDTARSDLSMHGIQQSSEPCQDGDRVSNLWNSIGLLGESGELVEAILDPESSDQKILKESGDVSWYNAMLLHRAFLSFGTALEINILRLKERYPEKFSTADSIARRDVKGE
jgi:NTP pyrophosphatase (non-canonical NTP hydrolase)